MADIVGPNGQPLQPNPFTSQQAPGLKSDVSVNTSSAERAFADLQKVLDGMTKNFAGSWEKATKDTLAGQERFYKYIGDKENERKISLERHKRAAIDSVKEETAARISGLEQELQAGKRTQEELNKGKIDLSRKADAQIKNIEREAKSREQGPNIFGKTLQGIQGVGGRIGGPIGGMISGAANLIAEPEIAIPAAIIGSILEIANKRAAFAKTGAQLAGAGFGSGSQVTASAFDQKLFGGLNGALSADEQRAIIAGMAGSRTMISQATTPGGMAGLQGNLGLFANILPDASKEMEIFTDATKSLGMSQKDISNIYMSSSVNANRLKITQLDAIQTQMDMQKALRNITNDGTVAADVLNTVGGFFKDIGKSETERTRMTLGVAQAGANLSLPTMAGMATFLNGGKMPTFSQMFGAPESGIGPSNGGLAGNPFSMMGNFISKIGGQFQDPMQKMFAADALNKQLGLGIQTQDLPQLFKLADRLGQSGPGGLNQEDFAKQAQALAGKSPEAMTAAGIQTLKDIVSPIQAMEKAFSTFWIQADVLFTKYFGAPRGSSVHPTSQSLPTQNVKKQVNGGKHSSDFQAPSISGQ